MMPIDLLLAALDVADILQLTGVILIVALGLGAVIFVHELGHFLVAKACGVRCDKFFVGFDIGGYKISRKWGETEYGIGILPLGGYVKMLGQDDDPAHVAEQMKKSEVGAARSDAVEVVGPGGERYHVDPRSYLAKSVPQRMAIISAGVIMNVIFAFIFAVIAFGMGVPYMPCIVSGTAPGSPAWQAAIEPGDEIIQIGERVDPTFNHLRGGVMLGDLEAGVPTVVRRAADGREQQIVLTPTRGRGLATIGIVSPSTLTLVDDFAASDGSAAARAVLVDRRAGEMDADEAKFRGGDRVVRVGDATVDDYRAFAAELALAVDRPVLVTVERKSGDAKRQAAESGDRAGLSELTFEVPPQPMRRLGLTMKMGPISAIQAGSPAEEVGLQVGDVIEAVDGLAMAQEPLGDSEASGERSLPTAGWDAMTLPDYLRGAAVDEREVELRIDRAATDGEAGEPLTIRVTPRVPTAFSSALPPEAPLAADALGIAYHIENEVLAVLPESPAAGGNLRSGDQILHAKVVQPKPAKGRTPPPIDIELGSDSLSWPRLLSFIQLTPAETKVELTVRREGAEKPHEVVLSPSVVEGLFVAERGFNFEALMRTRQAESFAEQLRYGWDETRHSLSLVFRVLSKIGTQVPVTALGGPVTIARAAGYSAFEGIPSLLVFLTMLSANLAVINFLPIPLLDGGHMVFLAYEGIRGRPASERFVVALHTTGFVLIVGLMLFVLGLDFGLIPRNL